MVIRGFLQGAALERLNRALDRFIQEVIPTRPATDAFYEDRKRPETLKQMQRLEQDPFFAEYLHHPPVASHG